MIAISESMEIVESAMVLFPELKILFGRGNAQEYFCRVLQDSRYDVVEFTKAEISLIREIYKSGDFTFEWNTSKKDAHTWFKFKGVYPKPNFKIKFRYKNAIA